MKFYFVILILVGAIPCTFAADQDPHKEYPTALLHNLFAENKTLSNKQRAIISLVEKGADPNDEILTERLAEPLLHRAFKERNNMLISSLLKHGAYIEPHFITADSAQVMLHLLCRLSDDNVSRSPNKKVLHNICALLNAGARLRQKDNNGITPLDSLHKTHPTLAPHTCTLNDEIEKARTTILKLLHSHFDPHVSQVVINYVQIITDVQPPELYPEQKVSEEE